MSTSRRQRSASKQRVRFRPQLEILEGRDLPSIGGAIQAVGNLINDFSRVAADKANLGVAQLQAAFDKNTGLGDPQQAQQTVQAAQQALGNDEAQFRQDLSNLIQNMLNPFSTISPNSSQTPTSQSSTSESPTSESSPSIVGTYTTIKPLVPNGTDGNVSANTPQSLTLVLNEDGSGSLSISPFAGTPQTVNFPKGTATYSGGSSVYLDYTSRYTATPIEVGLQGSLSDGDNALDVNLSVRNTTNQDFAIFNPATLNRVG